MSSLRPTRRVFLRTIAATAGTAALAEHCGNGPSPTDSSMDGAVDASPDAAMTDATDVPRVDAPPPNCDAGTGLFTDDQRRALSALCDYVFPPDAQPGATQIGAAQYIESFLNVLEQSGTPHIFAGGPFSGRMPYPTPTGGNASMIFPPNNYTQWVPLTRVSEFAYRLKLYGSANVPGGGPNDAVTGPVVGMRQQFQDGLCAALEMQPALGLEPIESTAMMSLWNALDQDFRDALVQLTLEGCFCAPEYGGNIDLQGWEIAGFTGDTVPLGYSIFDPASNTYRELPYAPVSTANPYPDPEPMDQDTLDTLRYFTMALGGRING